MSSDKPQESEKKESEYTFSWEWSTVVRAFYDKYPNPKMDFVKFNKLIGLTVGEDNTVKIKRLQYTKKFMIVWAYVLEEITIDANNKVLDMKSQIIKKSGVFPVVGIEYISYKAVKDALEGTEKTLYSKRLEIQGSINKVMSSFSDGFKNGIKIVEENCEQFKAMAADDWISRFSKSLSI